MLRNTLTGEDGLGSMPACVWVMGVGSYCGCTSCVEEKKVSKTVRSQVETQAVDGHEGGQVEG